MHAVRWASKQLLGVPAIRGLGLIHEITRTNGVIAVNHMYHNHPLQSETKEDIVKQYPTLFLRLGKLEDGHTINLKKAAGGN